jgi:hypothetical protein
MVFPSRLEETGGLDFEEDGGKEKTAGSRTTGAAYPWVDSPHATPFRVIHFYATSFERIAYMPRLHGKELPTCDNPRDSLGIGFTWAMQDPQLIKLSVVMARGCFESGTHSLSSSAWWFPQDVL